MDVRRDQCSHLPHLAFGRNPPQDPYGQPEVFTYGYNSFDRAAAAGFRTSTGRDWFEMSSGGLAQLALNLSQTGEPKAAWRDGSPEGEAAAAAFADHAKKTSKE